MNLKKFKVEYVDWTVLNAGILTQIDQVKVLKFDIGLGRFTVLGKSESSSRNSFRFFWVLAVLKRLLV